MFRVMESKYGWISTKGGLLLKRTVSPREQGKGFKVKESVYLVDEFFGNMT